MDIVSKKKQKHVSWLGKASGMGLTQDSEPSPQHMKSPTETWVCVHVVRDGMRCARGGRSPELELIL